MVKKSLLVLVGMLVVVIIGLSMFFQQQIDSILNANEIPYWLLALIALTIGWMAYLYKKLKG